MVETAPDPVLDFRYGWRWLLPISDVATVALIGFTEEERAFWQCVLPGAIFTDEPVMASVWLVQDVPPGQQPPPPALRTLCVKGARPVVMAWRDWLAGRFAVVQEYGLLPAAQPRVVIPLGSPGATRQALALHRPGRRMARLAVWAAGLWARMGWDWPLRGRSLLIASLTGAAFPRGARDAGLPVDGPDAPTVFALCLGNPEPDRKTVVLPLGWREQVILKVGEAPVAQAALRNEAAALRALSQTPLAVQVPRLLKVVDSGRELTLHQEFRPRQDVRRVRLHGAAVEFLAELSQVGRECRPLAEVLKTSPVREHTASAASGAAFAGVRAWLEARAAEGVMVWGNRSHGDFAPWNCAWTAQGWFVYDWEASQAWDMALGDAFYYILGPFLHIKGSAEIGKVHRRAQSMAIRLVERAGLEGVDVDLYLLLWVVKSLELYPEMAKVLEYLAGQYQL